MAPQKKKTEIPHKKIVTVYWLTQVNGTVFFLSKKQQICNIIMKGIEKLMSAHKEKDTTPPTKLNKP